MKRKAKVTGFVLSFDNGPHMVHLKIHRDHHAEQVLRGLVHSGYRVTIEETEIEVEVNVDSPMTESAYPAVMTAGTISNVTSDRSSF